VNPGTTTSALRSEPKNRDGLLAAAGGHRALTPISIVLLLTVAGAALRFGTLDVQSVWLDEATTMVLVRHSLWGMFSHLYSEETPPLYFVLAWIWTKIFGTGVLGFRSLSAVLGTITIPVMYAVGRRISPRVGLWAAALTVVSPAMYYFSQEARCYALLVLLSAAAFLFWLRVLQDEDGRSLALWAAMSALALLTHYYAIFMFIPEAALLLRRLGIRRMLAPVGVEALTGLALLPLALWQSSTYGEVMESTSTASRAAETVKLFLVGLYGPLEIYSALLVGVMAAGAVVYLWMRGEARWRRPALEIGFVGAAALLLPLVMALMHVASYSLDGRHLISAWIPCALLVAMGLGVVCQLKAAALLGLTICAVSLAVIVGINAIPGYQREDWRGVASALASHPGPSVIVTPRYGLQPLGIYLPHLHKTTAPSALSGELEFVALSKKRTGRSPLAPVVPTRPPRGYRLVEVRQTETYAVSRFLTTLPTATSVSALRAIDGEAETEVLLRG
jgi:mannosyltransferase